MFDIRGIIALIIFILIIFSFFYFDSTDYRRYKYSKEPYHYTTSSFISKYRSRYQHDYSIISNSMLNSMYMEEFIKPVEIKGVVINKFMSGRDRYIDIDNNDSLLFFSLQYIFDNSSEMVWYTVTIGDSIVKEKNTLLFKIKSNNNVKYFDRKGFSL